MPEVLATLEYKITADFSELQRKFEQFGNKVSNTNGGGKGQLKVGLDLSKAERQLADFDRKLARVRVIKIDADISAAESKINRLLSKVGSINVGGSSGSSIGGSALAGLAGAYIGLRSNRQIAGPSLRSLPGPSNQLMLPGPSSGIAPNNGVQFLGNVNVSGGATVSSPGQKTLAIPNKVSFTPAAGASGPGVWYTGKGDGGLGGGGSGGKGGGGGSGGKGGFFAGAFKKDIGYGGLGLAAAAYETMHLGVGYSDSSRVMRMSNNAQDQYAANQNFNQQLKGSFLGAGELGYGLAEKFNIRGLDFSKTGHNGLSEGFADQQAYANRTLQETERKELSAVKSARLKEANRQMDINAQSAGFATNLQTQTITATTSGTSSQRANLASELKKMGEDIRIMENEWSIQTGDMDKAKAKADQLRKGVVDYGNAVEQAIVAGEQSLAKFRKADLKSGKMRLNDNIRGADRLDIQAKYQEMIDDPNTSATDKAYYKKKMKQDLQLHDKSVANDSGNFIDANNASRYTARMNQKNLYSDNPNAAGTKFALEQQRNQAVEDAKRQGRGPDEINSIMQNFAAQLALLAEETKKTAEALSTNRDIELRGLRTQTKVNTLNAAMKPQQAQVAGMSGAYGQTKVANAKLLADALKSGDPAQIKFAKDKGIADAEVAKSGLGALSASIVGGGSAQAIGGYMGVGGMTDNKNDVAGALREIKDIAKKISDDIAELKK